MLNAAAIMKQLCFLDLREPEGGGIGKSIFVDPEAHILQTLGEAEMILIESKGWGTILPVRQYGPKGNCYETVFPFK
jgi:hypothetical protein